jgi:putative DNA primase/helicase
MRADGEARLMNARCAAVLLGGDANGPNALLAPGPGHSSHDRSMSVLFDPSAPDGFLVHSFAGDDPLVCRDHVRAALGLSVRRADDRSRLQLHRDSPQKGGALPVGESNEAARIAWALRLWDEAREPRGTVVEQYLGGRRLELSDDVARRALRFHPALRSAGGTTPGMVALLRDVRTDRPCGVHRTFLSAEGGKLGRAMLGRARGAAVKLSADDTVTLGIVVGEGIETCLAAWALGFRPVWALGSATAIAGLPTLPGVEALTILGEIDESGANARAAEACGRRWIAEGAEVSLVEPDAGDLNDVLQARRTAP